MSMSPDDSRITREVDRQMALLSRGAVQIISEEELAKKLRRSLLSKKPLRVKLGVDPTAHDLHLGFTLPLSKLQLFSELGHRPVLIIGDATAMVGDPTGKNAARPKLDHDTVRDFAKSYLDQAGRVLDMDRVEVRWNSEWLTRLGFQELIALMSRSTVARMLERDDFSKRHREGVPIYIHEFLYPLLQGHDSVVVEADVELGGQDQLFNLLVGRDLQVQAGQEPQVCMMGPLLVGLDGHRKMSKSYGNYIGVNEAANEMFGKVMSLSDETMRTWFELLTCVPQEEIERLFEGDTHPRELKDRLAREIVTRFHGKEAAAAASEEFRRVFANKELPSDIPEAVVPEEALGAEGIRLTRLLTLLGLAPSNKEARRLVEQGGVRVDDDVIRDPASEITPQGGEVLRVGKKRFVKLVVNRMK